MTLVRRAIAAEADKNGDGRINAVEWLAALRQHTGSASIGGSSRPGSAALPPPGRAGSFHQRGGGGGSGSMDAKSGVQSWSNRNKSHLPPLKGAPPPQQAGAGSAPPSETKFGGASGTQSWRARNGGSTGGAGAGPTIHHTRTGSGGGGSGSTAFTSAGTTLGGGGGIAGTQFELGGRALAAETASGAAGPGLNGSPTCAGSTSGGSGGAGVVAGSAALTGSPSLGAKRLHPSAAAAAGVIATAAPVLSKA